MVRRCRCLLYCFLGFVVPCFGWVGRNPKISRTQLRWSREYDAEIRTTKIESPRLWLESLPDGAYTVLRCDYPSMKLWGLEFHLERLQESYRCLVGDVEGVADAVEYTEQVLDDLMQEATKELPYLLSPRNANAILMLTTLWYPTDMGAISVRGHMYSDATPTDLWIAPRSASVVLALSNDALPNRYENDPEAKQSSWCTNRRVLEEMWPDADDIVLVETSGGIVHLLEGLTSNLWFVYPGNVLRTAPRGVLPGYSRQLVQEYGPRLGLRVEDIPVSLHERGFWEEVFLTSSIRLVVPVDEIRIPNKDGEGQVLWTRERDYSEDSTWKRIRDTLLQEELRELY